MTIALFGLPVSQGITIGRAIVLNTGRQEIDHYYIEPNQVKDELQRLKQAKKTVQQDLYLLQQQLPKNAPTDVSAILEVHIMMLQDTTLSESLQYWVNERHYNAEWALDSQLRTILHQFDEIEDDYIRQRKADIQQLADRLQDTLAKQKNGISKPAVEISPKPSAEPLIMVARDIAPADILHYKQSVFAGFVTDIGGTTSHSAIVARSMGIPALVGTRNASQIINPDDYIILDGNTGVVIINPSPLILTEYKDRQQQQTIENAKLNRLRYTPAITLDNQDIQLLANIELPQDAQKALDTGAAGIGLFRTEFLFMNHTGSQHQLPDEQIQYQAYKTVLQTMPDAPIVIRTIDIGADKPLDYGKNSKTQLNPALGLRAIRWSLAEPDIFLVQLRALLRAAVHGRLYILIPMLTHEWQIQQTLALVDNAKNALKKQNIPYGEVKIGAMIEVPAAALTLPIFLKFFDFLSIGTNDLIQYTLAIDRADESVSHLFDPLHPAILHLIANTIQQAHCVGKEVCICGEMAGDPAMTRLLLGLGLRSFSMHPNQILAIKKEILHCDTKRLEPLAQTILSAPTQAEQQSVWQALKAT